MIHFRFIFMDLDLDALRLHFLHYVFIFNYYLLSQFGLDFRCLDSPMVLRYKDSYFSENRHEFNLVALFLPLVLLNLIPFKCTICYIHREGAKISKYETC